MGADLRNFAIFENDDSIGAGNGAKPMGNNKASSMFHQRGHAGLD